MFLIVNYSKDKINIILSAARIAFIVLVLQAASRRFSPDQGDRRVVAKPVMILDLLIALCASINQPFSESSGFDESKRIILKVFLADVCLIDRWCVYD